MTRIATVLAAGWVVCSVAVLAQSRSVWDGVYTKSQAERGKKVYDQTCARCHGETLLGGDEAHPLVGDEFLEKWDAQPEWKLFDIIRRTMPDDGPNVLTRTQTADLVAFLLSANAFPAGTAEVSTEDEALKSVLITKARP
ncbi:MAG: c-type cytochrome [Vicinamibacterales bacterium]